MITKVVNVPSGSTGYILVRSIKQSATATDYSDFISIQYSDSGTGPDGNNRVVVNTKSNLLLSGGAIFAGDFKNADVGKFDPLVTTTTGSGVILNQYGLSGYKTGTQQFYIDARTGNAFFSGTISATIIESVGYSGVIDGSTFATTGMAINLVNGSITAKQFRIDTGGNAYFIGDVAGSIVGGSSLTSYVGSVAQTSANGKNVIHYGSTSGTSLTSGHGPNGTLYYTTGGTPLFSANTTISYSYSNQQIGDTFFSYNLAGNIIAQYTATSSSSWSSTQITSQVISELDVGKLTAGTISAAISMTSATIIGGLIETSAGTTQKIILSSTNDAIQFTNTSGTVISNIAPLHSGGTTYGSMWSIGSSPDYTFDGTYQDASIYIQSGEARMSFGGPSGNYVAANWQGTSIYGGPGGMFPNSVKLSGTATPGTSDVMGIIMHGTLNNLYKTTLSIASDPGTTPTGGQPGDIWLYY